MISCGSDFHGLEIKKEITLGYGNNNIPTDNEEIIIPLLKALKMA